MNDAFADLRKEVDEIKVNHSLQLDDAFVVWFLRAFTADLAAGEEISIQALTGGSGDKNIDAVYVNDEARAVFVIQAKYRVGAKSKSESRDSLIAFAQVSKTLLGDFAHFEDQVDQSNPGLYKTLKRVRRLLVERGYRLTLQFVTTGQVSKANRIDAERTLARGSVNLDVYDRAKLLTIAADYTEGAAPPLQSLDLKVLGEELFIRHEKHTGITSWVFSMAGADLARLYRDGRERIFARNIRGYLGLSEVNRAMTKTLTEEPNYFWYFNNGVTIVCDGAREMREGSDRILRVENAQIINGQQTTRVLAREQHDDASTLVKLLAIPRQQEKTRVAYGRFIGRVVEAANLQNTINFADLRSNDREQVRLERDLRSLRYAYVRKRQTRQESRRSVGSGRWTFVTKEELARAVGSCILAPEFWRQGQKQLFRDEYYGRVFSSRHAEQYLAMYWLNRVGRICAKGSPARGYALYLVLNVLWRELVEAGFGRAENCRRLRKLAERDKRFERELVDLRRVLVGYLIAAQTFYRLSEKTSASQSEASSFFRRQGVVAEFAKFWGSSNNHRRSKIESQLSRAIRRLMADETA